MLSHFAMFVTLSLTKVTESVGDLFVSSLIIHHTE
jgi:hypothetical protein